MKLNEKIVKSEFNIAVWGFGYIGLTTAMNFANKGVKCLGIDLNPNLVNMINNGIVPFTGLKEWFTLPFEEFVNQGLIKATANVNDVNFDQIDVHIICVNTDNEDEPFKDNLVTVLNTIAKKIKFVEQEKLIVIESTISPNWIDEDIEPIFEKLGNVSPLHLGFSPRRDWFLDRDKSQSNIPRVIGMSSEESNPLGYDLYSLCNDNVILASDWKHAAMVKVVENTIRYLGINFANQLSAAFPQLNVSEILKLCSTKWNIPEYHPSLGIGGYCIPLAPKYVLEGAKHNNHLKILDNGILWEGEYLEYLSTVIGNLQVRKIGILGLSYAPNLKIHKLSPAIKISKTLIEQGLDCKLYDPYYTQEEIKKVLNINTFDIQNDLDQFDVLIIVAAHKEFYNLRSYLDKGINKPIIIDNLGELKETFIDSNYPYFEMGNIKKLSNLKLNQLV